MRTIRQEVQLASLARAGHQRRRAAATAGPTDTDSELPDQLRAGSDAAAGAAASAQAQPRTARAGTGSSAHGGRAGTGSSAHGGRAAAAAGSADYDDLLSDDGLSADDFAEGHDLSRPLSPLSGRDRRARSRSSDLSSLKNPQVPLKGSQAPGAARAAAATAAAAAAGPAAGTGCDGFGAALNAGAAVLLAAEEAAAAAAAAAVGGAAQESVQDKAESAEAEDFDYRDFLKTVPGLPGCYRMYNSRGEVIYVGKARNLKNRLSSYFLKDQNIKTSALVSHIASIEFTVTFSETEALILENELIKKYQPHYNILLRDDKSYPFILLTTAHEHPGIYFHRGARRKKGDYFGPFPDSTAVKDSLRLMQRLFPIRQCEDTVYAHRSRPCLMAQIGKCLAPCVPMSEEKTRQYHEQVELIRLFLQGRNQELLTTMVKKMEEHAANMEFEQAAVLRDQLTTLRRVQESNSIVSGIEHPVDIIGYAMSGGMGCIHVLFIRNGRVFGSRSFFPRLSEQARSPRDLVLSFVGQFYLNDEHPNLIPDEVVLDPDYELVTGTAHLRPATPDPAASAAEGAAAAGPAGGPDISDVGESSIIDHSLYERPVNSDGDFTEAREFIDRIRSIDGQTDEAEDSDDYSASAAAQTDAAASATADAVAAVAGIDGDDGLMDDSEAESAAAAACSAAAQAAAAAGTQASGDGAGAEVGSERSELELIAAAVKERFGKNLRFNRGSRGARRRFLQLAMTNAQVSLDAKMASSSTAHRRIEDLEKLLGISGVERMECYDISHTMGELTVGSCVVFNREGPDSSRYRRYNIEGITPGDDFAAMHQVLTRRFKDPDGSECPQLIFIDGGPGQLAQAEQVLTAAFAQARTHMPVIVAVAKGEGRKEGLETLIRAFTHERIKLGLNSPALQLVIHIRDESHRFAITGHRNRRAKARRTSKLESVSGIGPKRRQALLKHLGGMQEVMRASVEELCKVPGISPKMAEHIYNELHG